MEVCFSEITLSFPFNPEESGSVPETSQPKSRVRIGVLEKKRTVTPGWRVSGERGDCVQGPDPRWHSCDCSSGVYDTVVYQLLAPYAESEN